MSSSSNDENDSDYDVEYNTTKVLQSPKNRKTSESVGKYFVQRAMSFEIHKNLSTILLEHFFLGSNYKIKEAILRSSTLQSINN